MRKTISVRLDQGDFEFLYQMTREEKSDLSKAVRDLVTRGRIMLAVERYKAGQASLGRAAGIAGVSIGEMMAILTEFGVESRIEQDDYLRSIENLVRL